MTTPIADTGTNAQPGSALACRDRRLHVLFVNDTSRKGGPGKTLLDILRFLDPARIHRTVLIPREGFVSRSLLESGAADRIILEPDFIENIFEPLTRQIIREDFNASIALKALRASGNVARAARGLFRMMRRVRKEQFDLVFCNGTAANFVGGAIAAFTGVPVIWHVFYPSVAPLIRPLHDRLAAGKNVRSIVCVSNFTALQLKHVREKISIINDALDIGEFDDTAAQSTMRDELRMDPSTVVFGSHGRIVPKKGFVELICASRIVFDRLTVEERARCRFVVLGDTPQDMQSDHLEECRQLVRTLGLETLVQFIGFRADVRAYVADFDVGVAPSVFDDSLPRAVMESMAMGKPVVAFAVGGIGEMIDDNIEGRLLRGSPPDIDGLAQACLDYFHDREKRLRHGAAARSRVERSFEAGKHGVALQNEMLRVAAGIDRDAIGLQTTA